MRRGSSSSTSTASRSRPSSAPAVSRGYSQDSIAEFQFISNRFDATQGRSTGVQVNADHQVGHQQALGPVPDQLPRQPLQREDPVLNRVVPINNQQYSTAVGGPIVTDKLHYFGNFEYEREPRTQHLEHAVSGVQHRVDGHRQQEAGRRSPGLSAVAADARDGQGLRDSRAGSRSDLGAATSHPAQTGTTDERNEEYLGQFTQVLSNRALNEVKVGYSHYGFANELLTNWSKHWQAPRVTNGHPRITLHRLFDRRQRQLSAAPRPEGVRRCATTSRSPTTRAAATTCRPAENSCAISRTARTATSAAARSTPT